MKSEKITDSRRRYDDACGMAHAMDLLGERWSLLVVRELMLGPKRFGELRADLPGLSANVLTQRLDGLERSGLVVRRRLPPPANAQVYALTQWGYETEPLMQALGRWAARSAWHDPKLPISAVSVLLSFRTMLNRERARGIDAVVGFRLGEEQYRGKLDADGLAIARGEIDDADLVFAGQPVALAAAVYGGVPFEALGGSLSVTGDKALAARFVTLFPLPEKVVAG